MLRYFSFLLLLSYSISTTAQDITAQELLDNSIAYHDPNANWTTFKGELVIVMNTPNKAERKTSITINLPKEYFKAEVLKNNTTITYQLEKENCSLFLNGDAKIPTTTKDSLKINCNRARLLKDYYTYLYGLPMKLKDPGTIIDATILTKTLKDKTYLVLKVNYTEDVGKDSWYFYFNPDNYALEAYQFYHDETKNDGEYILLTGQEIINEIKIPKSRAWYYNKDAAYLATDILLAPKETP